MRIRITQGEVEFYSKSQRENKTVYVQGRNWRVLGVIADMMGGIVTHNLGDARGPARVNPAPGRVAQWFVELAEA